MGSGHVDVSIVTDVSVRQYATHVQSWHCHQYTIPICPEQYALECCQNGHTTCLNWYSGEHSSTPELAVSMAAIERYVS
jgi:hypothetical protein